MGGGARASRSGTPCACSRDRRCNSSTVAGGLAGRTRALRSCQRRIAAFCRRLASRFDRYRSERESKTGLAILGNVAQSVLQHSYCPVHIARLKNADVAPEHQPPISNILVAVDHSPHSNATVDWVLRQGWIPPYRVKLLTALPEVAEQISKEKNAEKASKLVKEQQELKSRVDERLKACALGMEARMGAGLVEYESIEGPPADVILQAAHDWPADLIVIGSHGRSAITRFLLGTVSQSVAINAPCPVEVIKLNSYPIQEKPHEEIHQRTDEDQDRMPHVMM